MNRVKYPKPLAVKMLFPKTPSDIQNNFSTPSDIQNNFSNL